MFRDHFFGVDLRQQVFSGGVSLGQASPDLANGFLLTLEKPFFAFVAGHLDSPGFQVQNEFGSGGSQNQQHSTRSRLLDFDRLPGDDFDVKLHQQQAVVIAIDLGSSFAIEFADDNFNQVPPGW